MPKFETVLYDVDGRIATITLNRPERMNAMNQTLKDELRECWRRVKADPNIWVAILTGAGDAFSSGADVESLASGALLTTMPASSRARSKSFAAGTTSVTRPTSYARCALMRSRLPRSAMRRQTARGTRRAMFTISCDDT